MAKKFESSVISYGDKTQQVELHSKLKFESSVISYGDKTIYLAQMFPVRV